MASENSSWEAYYQKLQGRAPRPLVLAVLKAFEEDVIQNDSHQAIDLGCGDGTETLEILSRGWNVLAIDGEPNAIQRLLEKVPEAARDRLQTQVTKFEDVTLPAADLIHASLSIPFCHPDHFPALWEKIAHAVKPSGRFAGHFFGVHDSWADQKDKTFHTEEQVRTLLLSFEIESFHEMDEDGQAVSGPKHWHVFTVIAKKK